MERKSFNTTEKAETVVVSSDISLNARLQKLLKENKLPGRGFFDVEAAINWSKTHHNQNSIYLLIPPFEQRSLQDATMSLFQINTETNCIVLVDPEDYQKIKRLGFEIETLEILEKSEKIYNLLPIIIRQILLRIEAEKQLKEITNQNSPDAMLSDHVAKELADISLKRIKRQEKHLQHESETMIKSSFLKYMSLEIRNPVSAVIGMARTLEKTKLNKEQKAYLNSILISGSNLIILLNDILHFANIRAGKQELVYHSVHVRTILDEVIEIHKEEAEKKEIILHAEVHNTVPTAITGDKLKIQQVLNNLVAHALHCTESGRVDVIISIISDKDREVSLSFSVTDTGSGVQEEEISHVFDSFCKMENPGGKMQKGSGMGLAIARSLVELMGGEIGIDSEYDKGSHIHFSIPLLSKEGVGVEDREIIYSAPKKKLKILLAEDDTINQMYLAGFLRSQSWEVDTAYNGLDALDLFFSGKYDLVILDGQMPKMDGFETAKKIRNTDNNKKNVPILAVSGYANPEDKERFLKAGMNAYLSKPIDEQELLQVIYKLTK